MKGFEEGGAKKRQAIIEGDMISCGVQEGPLPDAFGYCQVSLSTAKRHLEFRPRCLLASGIPAGASDESDGLPPMLWLSPQKGQYPLIREYTVDDTRILAWFKVYS